MNQNLELIENIQSKNVKQENSFYSISTLNNYMKFHKECILYFNIRSLNANYKKLQIFIESIKVKPLMIVCVETWNLEYYKYFSLNGYSMYYNNSKINKSDGVVVYISNNITENTEVIQIGKLKILNSLIKIDDKNSIEISSLYRSHDLPKTEFIMNLKEILKIKKNTKNHLIIGDFNMDLINIDSISQEYLNNLLGKGYRPGFQTITRPADNNEGGTCIDNCFIKVKSFDINTHKLIHSLTDHYPLFVTLEKIKLKKTIENFSYIEYGKLNKLAVKENWDKILSVQDPNIAIDSLIHMIQNCINNATLNKKVNKNVTKTNPRKNWITKAIITSCNKKELLYNIWKLEPNNEKLKVEYKNYEKILSKIIKHAKLVHDRRQVENYSKNPRKLWNIINQKLGKKFDRKETITQICNKDMQIVTNPKEIANIMNAYFNNIGTDLSEKIQRIPNSEILMPEMNPKSIFLNPTNYSEISNIIDVMELKNGGVDNINVKTLKIIKRFIVIPLVHICNLCIEKSLWPDALKCAVIKPVHKAKNKTNAENYRPISLISNLAKILEKLIYSRFSNFINKCDLISKNQFGFIKNKGTKNALQHISNIIYNCLDQNKPIAITFLDLAKAFDTINHRILLDKLYNYGIRGKAYKLISSYLSNRQQNVKISNSISDCKTIRTGVPQGTILGPLLFILYVNDMIKDNIISYADDTAIIATDDSWKGVETKMNNYLKSTSVWLALNKLSLNVGKTTYITFGNYYDSVPSTINIQINNNELKRVESCRYLGLIFDYKMKWDKHIDYLISRTKYLIFIFYKLSKVMNFETLRTIYYSLFNSIVSYGIIAWGGAYTSTKTLLQNLQYKLLKIMNKNNFNKHRNPMNLEQIYALESLTYHYDDLKSRYLASNSITRKKYIQIPRRNKTVSSKNSYIKAINLFNNLPNDLKSLCTQNKKNKLKDWLLLN